MGSIYVQNDNSIGVNGIESLDKIFIKNFWTIVQKIKPLPPLPSSRYKDFFVNISLIIKSWLIAKLYRFIPSQISYINSKND